MCLPNSAWLRVTKTNKTLQRQSKNQIDNLFIKPKSKLQQVVHPHKTQNEASLIDAVSLHSCTMLTFCCTILHNVLVIRSSLSFQEPPVRMKMYFFFFTSKWFPQKITYTIFYIQDWNNTMVRQRVVHPSSSSENEINLEEKMAAWHPGVKRARPGVGAAISTRAFLPRHERRTKQKSHYS